MVLESQVSSLALSQRLKELGVKQESLFIWYGIPHDVGDKVGTIKLRWKIRKAVNDHNPAKYSAFTVAELGEMLPKTIKLPNRVLVFYLYISWDETSNKWRYAYANKRENECAEMFFADTEADARAKMLIYLVENKLIAL